MGLTWPAFGKLQGVAGVGVNALRSAIWSELASDWVANNNPMPIRIVGRSPSPAATLPATDIWPANTVRAVPPSAGFTIAVASDSATDSNSLATGAMQLTVPYLDTTYTWHYCVFALNGTTKVNTVLSIDGVAQAAGVSVTNAMEVLPWSFVSASGVAGSLNTALQAGNIYIGNNTDAFTSGIPAAANMFDKLLIGDNRSNLGVFTVPAGMSLLVLHAYVFNSAAADRTILRKDVDRRGAMAWHSGGRCVDARGRTNHAVAEHDFRSPFLDGGRP